MLTCPNCHHVENDDVKFCPNCGTLIRNSDVPINHSPQVFSSAPVGSSVISSPFSNPYYQPPPNNPYYQGTPYGYMSPRNYDGRVDRPPVITPIVVYEISLGFLLSLIGMVLVYFSVKGSTLFSANSQELFIILGIILIIWGLCGIAGGVLFFQWKQSGLILSYIFLISAGIVLFFVYLVPTTIAIASIFYFNTNTDFKISFNLMINKKVQK